MNKKVDFGFQDIPEQHKAAKVSAIFSQVAARYDVMNDAMSFGLHRLWKRHFIAKANIRSGSTVCDLAAGTADVTLLMARKMAGEGRIVMSDINKNMLDIGYNKVIDAGYTDMVEPVVADAMALPFDDNTFNLVTMVFWLRNVTDKKQALAEMCRIVKPGGTVLVMEFSKPQNDLVETLYDRYSFNLIPKLGEYIANDASSYQYLVESIRRHPDQNTLQSWFYEVGYDMCTVENILSGVVAIHTGVKT